MNIDYKNRGFKADEPYTVKSYEAEFTKFFPECTRRQRSTVACIAVNCGEFLYYDEKNSYVVMKNNNEKIQYVGIDGGINSLAGINKRKEIDEITQGKILYELIELLDVFYVQIIDENGFCSKSFLLNDFLAWIEHTKVDGYKIIDVDTLRTFKTKEREYSELIQATNSDAKKGFVPISESVYQKLVTKLKDEDTDGFTDGERAYTVGQYNKGYALYVLESLTVKEEVEAGLFKGFDFLKEYPFSLIEQFAEIKTLEIEEMGANEIGLNHLFLKDDDGEHYATFILSSASSNDYYYRNVFLSADCSKDGKYHS